MLPSERWLIADGEMIANNPEYTTAAALLLKGTENCALYIAPEPETESGRTEDRAERRTRDR